MMKMPVNDGLWKAFIKKRLKKRYWVVMVRRRPWVKWVLLLCLLALPSSAVWAWYHYGKLTDDQNQPLDFEKLRKKDFYKASYVYDSEGEQMGRFFYEPPLDYTTFKEIPELVKMAFIATEDQSFYRYRFLEINLNFGHPGVDPIAISRAAFFNLVHKLTGYYTRSGASTIEQQAARQLYEKNVADFRNRVQTFQRKIQEGRIAVKLNDIYSKDEIFECFANLPYLGHGTKGMKTAWQVYFNKDLGHDPVTIREAAMIAALHKSPKEFCPIYHKPLKPKIPPNTEEKTKIKLEQEYEIKDAVEMARVLRTRKRQNYVMERMYKEGYISFEAYEKERFKENEPLNSEIIRFTPIKKRQYVYANRMVKELLMFNGFSDEDITKQAGLRTYTSLNRKIQQILTEEVNKQLAELNKELPTSDPIEGSFIVLDAKTGEIRAMSGGHEDVSEMQYNRLLARRSPGSAIKPFVYAMALEEGGTLDDLIWNGPLRMIGANGKLWAPENFPEKRPVPNGKIPRAIGFIRSVNLPTIHMVMSIKNGIEKFIELSHRCGLWGNRNVLKDSDGLVWFKYFSSLEEPGSSGIEDGLVPKLPTVIGGSGLSLVELAAGYGIFARHGKYIQPSLITRITDSEGREIYKFNRPREKQVISKRTADMITMLGRAVTKFGTLKISMRGIEQQIAGKTGTSNSAGINIYGQPSEGPADVLVASWNPEYVILIRFGHDKMRSIEVPQYMKRVGGERESGGWLVGKAARNAWDRIYKDRPKVAFDDNIEVGTTELVEKYGNKY